MNLWVIFTATKGKYNVKRITKSILIGAWKTSKRKIIRIIKTINETNNHKWY